MRRAGGWILGLIIVAAMAGGGWFALRRVLSREPATIILLRTENARGPTSDAIVRGAQFALREWGGRAGGFQIQLIENGQGIPAGAPVWIGTSEALLLQGDVQPVPFFVSVLDTHPAEPTGCFRMIPGCNRQGRAAAAWAKKSKAVRAFLLRDRPSLRSGAIAAAFESAASELGLPVEGPVDSSLDQPALLNRILASNPDLVFYSGEEAPYSTSHAIFSALREKGFAGTLVMGEADPEVSFLATRPDLVEGTYLVSPFAPPPPELAGHYFKFAGTRPGPHVTAGYFAMKATLEAIDRAGSIDPADLRRAVTKLPYFDAEGKAALRPCALYVARNGKFEFVENLK
jgi:hypothetical protein